MRTRRLLGWALFCSSCTLSEPLLPTSESADGSANSSPDFAGVQDFCNATDPRAVAPWVWATPEAGEKPYVDLLKSAQKSIRVEIYLMGYGGILDTLKQKASAGVSVKVILDQGEPPNQKYFDELKAAGAQVLWNDPKFPYMHAKFIVVDDGKAMVSTGNFSLKVGILQERNFMAQLADPADVADLVALFDADWQRQKPDMSCTRLLISPINSRPRLLDLIRSASQTLTLESMQFADTEVRAAVQTRHAAGVKIRALLADATWIAANAEAASFLKSLGIPVKSIPHLHTKVVVVDGQRAYLGSANLSFTSLSKNREVGLILTEASSLKPLVDTFEKDWAAGQDF